MSVISPNRVTAVARLIVNLLVRPTTDLEYSASDPRTVGPWRSRIRICAVTTATTASTATPARATRIRVLRDVSDQDRIVAVGQSNQDFRRFISDVRAGQIRRHGALTVLWLHAAETGPALDVATLDEARAQGILVVTERAQASVPELLVENRGKAHVLLLAGEILVGGKQNRVLKEDVLLPPLSGVRNLGVYCVEQGRWNTGRTDFESKSTLAAPSLRSRLMEKADQAQVWTEVMKSARAARASSPTGSYQEIYETPEVKEHLKEVEHGISVTPPAGALGAAVFVGAGMAGLDLFQPGSLFAREWSSSCAPMPWRRTGRRRSQRRSPSSIGA